jgi:hypothetical protein
VKPFVLHHAREIARGLAMTLFAALALVVLPGIVVAQDAPAADCDSGPNVACPAPGDPSARYIGSVTAVSDGVVILLTDDGLASARECGGPNAIAAMAHALYETIPTDLRADFQLDWTSERLYDEIYGHAFLNRLLGGIGALDVIHERTNPINIVFADYGGPGEMSADARAEHATYSALGVVQRASCS